MKRFHILAIGIAFAAAMLLMSSCANKAGTGTGTGQNTQSQNGGNVNVTDNNNNGIVVGQNMEWPAGSMGSLPQLKGQVTAVIKSDKDCAVTLTGCSKEDVTAYVTQLKNSGYGNGMDMVDANGYIFTGTKSDNSSVALSYTMSSGEVTLSYVSGSSSALAATEDMTDKAPWPGNFIKGVPELAGKITDVVNNNNTEITVSVKYVQKADFEAFVQQVKQNGYTVDSDESSSVSNIRYEAYSASREWVRAYLSINSDGNTAEIIMEKASDTDQ